MSWEGVLRQPAVICVWENLVTFLVDASFVVYLAIFAGGLAWVVVSLLLGGLGDLFGAAAEAVGEIGGGELDTDSWGNRQVGLSPFSPLMVAVFAMLFGVSGMVATAMTGLGLVPVLFVAVVVGVGLDAGVYSLLVRFLVRSQSSSISSHEEAVGGTATVTSRIPAGGLGSVDIIVGGRRTISSARGPAEGSLEPGDLVDIISMDGGIAQVRKKE